MSTHTPEPGRQIDRHSRTPTGATVHDRWAGGRPVVDDGGAPRGELAILDAAGVRRPTGFP